MKALIWIGCLGVFATVEGISVLLGYELGVAPTILNASAISSSQFVPSMRITHTLTSDAFIALPP